MFLYFEVRLEVLVLKPHHWVSHNYYNVACSLQTVYMTNVVSLVPRLLAGSLVA